jgi:hypothetical protein
MLLHVALLLNAALLLKLTLPAGASRMSQMLEAAERLPTPRLASISLKVGG